MKTLSDDSAEKIKAQLDAAWDIHLQNKMLNKASIHAYTPKIHAKASSVDGKETITYIQACALCFGFFAVSLIIYMVISK